MMKSKDRQKGGVHMGYRCDHGTVDIVGVSGNHMHYIVNELQERKSKLFYRAPKFALDSRAGLYFTAHFPDGGSKRFYVSELVEYR